MCGPIDTVFYTGPGIGPDHAVGTIAIVVVRIGTTAVAKHVVQTARLTAAHISKRRRKLRESGITGAQKRRYDHFNRLTQLGVEPSQPGWTDQ